MAPWACAALVALSACHPLAVGEVGGRPAGVGTMNMDMSSPQAPGAAAPLVKSAHHGTSEPGEAAPAFAAPAPATHPPAANGASGGGLATARPPEPGAPRLRLSDGREIVLEGGDAVALPSGLTGLVSLFVPGRVPSTIELSEGLTLLHPQAIANAPEPSGLAVIEGRVAPGASVAYHAPGRTAYVGAFADAEGAFRLEVPLDGAEAGVLLAADAQATPALALAAVSLRAGETTTAPPLALALPDGQAPAPALPSAWRWEGAWLSAVPAGPVNWRLPVLMRAGGEPLPLYEAPGFTLVASHAAARADGTQGGLVSGPPGALPAWLDAPDLAGLPATLADGTAIAWPAVPGAGLYTLRLTSPDQTSPVWEAACVTPRLTVPDGLALGQSGLKLEVTAWDAPELTVYAVASLRALRLPAGPAGLVGRLSWARRAVGSSVK